MAKKDTKGTDASPADAPELKLDAKDQGAYRVLARKYRPQTFDALVGQDAMVRTLANAFAANRIAHAFMLTGVRGVGKTTTARIIAKALNCIGKDGKRKEPTMTPCGVCEPCKAIAESRHVDVLEMDAASRTGIDDIREIVEGVRYAPAEARYKVYIIDEVHMLSKAAFNGLLKTLEEPPPHVKFIFATTEIRKVPVTVLSRCQRFDLKRVPLDELAANLASICKAEKYPAEEGALLLIARAAEGSVRDAQSLLDQAMSHGGGAEIEEEAVRAMLGLADRSRGLTLFDQLMRGAIAEALAEFRSQYDSGADPLSILQDLTQITHEVTRAKIVPGAAARGVPDADVKRYGELGAKLSVPQLARAWQLLLKALPEVQEAPDAAAAAEMALVRIAYAAELPPTDALIKAAGSASTTAASRPMGHAAPAAPPSPPPLRAQARGDAAPARARVEPQEQPKAALAAERIDLPQDFRALVALMRNAREARLTYALEHYVHIVSYDRGRIEMRVEPAAPATLPGDLSDKLAKLTGARWVITVSGAEGEPTLAEQAAAEDASRRASAAQDPLLKAALAVFPGAKIVAVRDREIPETESDPSDDE
ncbi:MAG: DNA polymerase III subunit gamma/tau [Alphaproteobacteria bacterium]|nr:DNA polymerase III subunit gamma/tau [Alphaproteobacteria bacterium]